MKKMSKTQELINKIMNEEDNTIELSGCALNELSGEPNDIFSEDTGLQPEGNFAYMVEFFSFDLVNADDSKYQGAYGLNDEYIKDALILTKKVQFRAESLRQDYEDKGVQITVNGFNDGCEGGLAVYVWIPHQTDGATVEIHGSLFVNSAKYEYVDKIVVTDEEVDIYHNGYIIGSILRENIDTMFERNYELSIVTDLVENLCFDIRKPGDF